MTHLPNTLAEFFNRMAPDFVQQWRLTQTEIGILQDSFRNSVGPMTNTLRASVHNGTYIDQNMIVNAINDFFGKFAQALDNSRRQQPAMYGNGYGMPMMNGAYNQMGGYSGGYPSASPPQNSFNYGSQSLLSNGMSSSMPMTGFPSAGNNNISNNTNNSNTQITKVNTSQPQSTNTKPREIVTYREPDIVPSSKEFLERYSNRFYELKEHCNITLRDHCIHLFDVETRDVIFRNRHDAIKDFISANKELVTNSKNVISLEYKEFYNYNKTSKELYTQLDKAYSAYIKPDGDEITFHDTINLFKEMNYSLSEDIFSRLVKTMNDLLSTYLVIDENSPVISISTIEDILSLSDNNCMEELKPFSEHPDYLRKIRSMYKILMNKYFYDRSTKISRLLNPTTQQMEYILSDHVIGRYRDIDKTEYYFCNDEDQLALVESMFSTILCFSKQNILYLSYRDSYFDNKPDSWIVDDHSKFIHTVCERALTHDKSLILMVPENKVEYHVGKTLNNKLIFKKI